MAAVLSIFIFDPRGISSRRSKRRGLELVQSFCWQDM
jgi:hypothetical protein